MNANGYRNVESWQDRNNKEYHLPRQHNSLLENCENDQNFTNKTTNEYDGTRKIDRSIDNSENESQNFMLRFTESLDLDDSMTYKKHCDTRTLQNKRQNVAVLSDSNTSSTYSGSKKKYNLHLNRKNVSNKQETDKVYVIESSDSEADLRDESSFSYSKYTLSEKDVFTPNGCSNKQTAFEINTVHKDENHSKNKVNPRNIESSQYHRMLNKKSIVQNNQRSLATPMTKLSKHDTRNILKVIQSTKAVYFSPNQVNSKSRNRRISDDINAPSTMDEDVIVPSTCSINLNKKIEENIIIIDETASELDSEDEIRSSDAHVLKPPKTHVSRFLQTPKKKNESPSLSEHKKKEISLWLMTNSPGSRSDSSSSNVSDSNRNSVSSGNSSLERFEMKHETPNNRGKLSKINNSRKLPALEFTKENNPLIKKSTYIPNTVHPIINVLNKVDKNESAKEVVSKKTENPTSVKNMDIMDCADILDKLYGHVWRSEANELLPMSEPRNQTITKKDRAVQTERRVNVRKKILSRRISYSDSDEDSYDLVQNMQPIFNSTSKSKRSDKERRDSFLDDGSLSENSPESVYLTALTNPRIFGNSSNCQKSTPISLTTQRAKKICDPDSEEDTTTMQNFKNKKRLSFTDDDSSDSSTSEFDPGDVVPPKSTSKKGTKKLPNQALEKKNKSSTRNLNEREKSGIKSFLASLSETVSLANCHPDAKKYRTNFKNTKEELCKHLFKLYNEKIFNKKLPEDMSIEWNVRMRGTAGFCYNKKSVKALGAVTRSSRIVLATKIIDRPDRLRDTLVHEMCHAAAWLINNVSDGHGSYWKGWASKAMQVFPDLPPIRRCHDYQIKTKFTYRCMNCGYSIGRHSKSLDVEKKRCGHCYGKFELLTNKVTKSGTVQVATPAHTKTPSGFALYVKQNYNLIKSKRRSLKHGDVMKILSSQFANLKIAKKTEEVVELSP
ncbi:dentin sialophosphoprotein isoform X2 [Cephus cinctus]|nr:dentin sialophosphoprotein isoform X2 [Cephus cinctus]XP_015603581.1 dentin sialophosphoprotein isoform X2 [Cephus cinctus]